MRMPAGKGRKVSRRRFIVAAAAAAGSGLLPHMAAARTVKTFDWRGVALGAEATLTLQHYDEVEARGAIAACLAEIARLEMIFSLHRPDSALSMLNRMGRIEDAPHDLRILLAEALHLAAATQGAFDPTIQPLWTLYARHFDDPAADAGGPTAKEISRAQALAGWQDVSIWGSQIVLSRNGMAITLNGIAQGYITDKVGDVLRARGFHHVLVNMGEQLATGPKWDGVAWNVGIVDPTSAASVIEEFPLHQGAVATSGGMGCRFRRGRTLHAYPRCTNGSAGTPGCQRERGRRACDYCRWPLNRAGHPSTR